MRKPNGSALALWRFHVRSKSAPRFTPLASLTTLTTLTPLSEVPKKIQARNPLIKVSIIRSISSVFFTHGKSGMEINSEVIP